MKDVHKKEKSGARDASPGRRQKEEQGAREEKRRLTPCEEELRKEKLKAKEGQASAAATASMHQA